MQSLSTFVRFVIVASVLWIGEASAGPIPLPVKEVASIAQFKPNGIEDYDGRLRFWQYDVSGNTADVVELDIADASARIILHGTREGRYVASSGKYLVYTERRSMADPLIVVDRATGKPVGQIKLAHGIRWARIEGDRLIVIQLAGGPAGLADRAAWLEFALPDLKIIKQGDIARGNVQEWNQNIVVPGKNQFIAYDGQLNELFRIAMPQPKRAEGNISCAGIGSFHVSGDMAVVAANCGQIQAYDLQARRLDYMIPAYAHSYQLAIVKGLLFAVPADVSYGTGDSRRCECVHVHDLATGRELAVLPVNAAGMFGKGDRLLILQGGANPAHEMTIYAVDEPALRDGRWRLQQVRAECTQADAQLMESGDLYAAISRCRNAGVEALAGEPANPPETRAIVKRYALWLSQTLDMTAEAIEVLERVQQVEPDRDVSRALAETRLKARVFDDKDVGPLSDEERRTEFGRTLADRPSQAESRTIGGFDNHPLAFSERRVYVALDSCSECPSGGAAIKVLDRDTFAELDTIAISPEGQQDSMYVQSITPVGKRVYVTVQYDQEDAARPGLLVLEEGSSSIVKRVIGSFGPLIADRGQLFECGCAFPDTPECVVRDPATAQTTPTPGKVCANGGENITHEVVDFTNGESSSLQFLAITRDYLVAKKPFSTDGGYFAYPRAGGGKMQSMQLNPHDPLTFPASISGDTILTTQHIRNGLLLKTVEVPSGAVRTLLGLPFWGQSPVLLLHGDILFIGLGHDLLVFDVGRRRVLNFFRDFVPAGFADNGSGLDKNRIADLVIDRDRLIARTFYGENSQVVPLSALDDVRN